jgi:hypothetical protein
MKKSWFQHVELTEHQALELVERYRKANYQVEILIPGSGVMGSQRIFT